MVRQKKLWKTQKKHKLHKPLLNTRAGIDYSKYIKSRNECNRIFKNAKCIYEKLLARESKSNPKLFWKCINEKLKSNVSISPLQVDNDL